MRNCRRRQSLDLGSGLAPEPVSSVAPHTLVRVRVKSNHQLNNKSIKFRQKPRLRRKAPGDRPRRSAITRNGLLVEHFGQQTSFLNDRTKPVATRVTTRSKDSRRELPARNRRRLGAVELGASPVEKPRPSPDRGFFCRDLHASAWPTKRASSASPTPRRRAWPGQGDKGPSPFVLRRPPTAVSPPREPRSSCPTC